MKVAVYHEPSLIFKILHWLFVVQRWRMGVFWILDAIHEFHDHANVQQLYKRTHGFCENICWKFVMFDHTQPLGCNKKHLQRCCKRGECAEHRQYVLQPDDNHSVIISVRHNWVDDVWNDIRHDRHSMFQ